MPQVAVAPIASPRDSLLTSEDEASQLPGKLVPEPLINSEKAAVIIGIHPKTLQKYARRGLIRGIQVGKRWRFRASVIDEWIVRKYAN